MRHFLVAVCACLVAFLWAVLFPSVSSCVVAQGVTDNKPNYASELPRIPAKEPLESMATVQLKDGFRLELAAAEPLVRDPVAMAFDGDGRMFVVEMCDYSEQDKEFLGNVRMLEDNDNDGRYEKSTLFAHHLSWPTGVICFDGGVFVAAAPDIFYLKDTDGDGQADIQRQIFTGFGRQNVQGLLNSFCWGLDNRIYCQTSSCGGSITSPSLPNQAPIQLGGRDFSFDPKTLDIRLESGGGQHGMSFDDWGRRFVCHNSDHLQLFLYPDRYTTAADQVPLPPSRQSIAADGPQASVYRISPIEPWRLVRTRLRVTNQSPGLIEGGGRPAGYFTSATGITIYRGDAYPEDMLGTAIVGDVGSNIVHRKRLTENGISMIGNRIDQESEFIASTDIWFRPVQFANAPDGTLYLADLYREVIEHPRSLPEEIKQHLDLTSGRDRGRIYRVVPPIFKRPPKPALENASVADLIRALNHKNGWQRDTVCRKLYERLLLHGSAADVSDAVPKLTEVALKSTIAQARLHALGMLSTIGAGQGASLAALNDPHSRVREFAVSLLGAGQGGEAAVVQKLQALALDNDARVRFQVAMALNRISVEANQRVKIALTILLNGNQEGDAWVSTAALNAIGTLAAGAVESLANDAGQGRGGLSESPAFAMLGNLVGKIASEDQWDSISTSLDRIRGDNANNHMHLSVGLIESLQRRFTTRETLQGVLAKLPSVASIRTTLVDSSRTICADNLAAPEKRVDAIKYLLWESSDEEIPLLAGLIDQQQPASVQEAATRALMRFQSDAVATQLLKAWPALSPRLRNLTSDVIFSRANWIEVLLNEAGQGGFALLELEPTKIANLKSNPKTQERVMQLLKSSSSGSRQEIYTEYRKALGMAGDKTRGKAAFAKSCAACHRVEGVGFELAPNLATFQFRGAEAILQNIIEPNREVNPQYLNYTVLTKDDRIVTGMIADESATSVTLLKGENVRETILRSDIAEMKSSKLSLMPEGLENQLDLQTMADLLTYLTTLP